MNPQDEILAAACNALDKAHALLSRVVLYHNLIDFPPEFIAECQAWIDGEYDPGERAPKPCEHRWKKAVLDDSVGCTLCGVTQQSELEKETGFKG